MQEIIARIWIGVAIFSCSNRPLLVERQFTHTVDGVVDILTHLGHTVF